MSKYWAITKERHSLVHGHNRKNRTSSTYKSWHSMKQRCLNANSPDYYLYGGRGIKICDRWLDFKNFLSDMKIRPEGTSLERINTNENYELTNCKWGTIKEQNLNKRNVKLFIINGITDTLSGWAKTKGLWKGTVSAGLKRGMSIEESLNI
jgi:hypothetical protein